MYLMYDNARLEICKAEWRAGKFVSAHSEEMGEPLAIVQNAEINYHEIDSLLRPVTYLRQSILEIRSNGVFADG